MVEVLPNSIRRESYTLAVVLFLLGFLGFALVIHLLIPNPLRLYASLRSEKIALLDGTNGEVCSAAFGSSRINDGFDPRAFDDELTAISRGIATINLGIEGGSQTEQRAVALEFARRYAGRPKRQERHCFVLLELNAGANFTNDHLIHPRAINIYDWSTFKFVNLLTDSRFRVRKASRDGFALAAMAMHYTNMGMLSSSILQPPIDYTVLAEETADGRNGLHSLPTTPQPLIYAEYGSHPPAKSTPAPLSLTRGNNLLVQELAQRAGDPSLHFIYIVSPLYSNLESYPTYPDSFETPNGVEPILNIARPDLYPQLFEPRYWHDPSHLNSDGAAFAGRLLADQLESWYAAHGRGLSNGGQVAFR